MQRAYKYRIYPTEEQEVLLAKTFGCVRVVWNWALDARQTLYNIKNFGLGLNEVLPSVRGKVKPAKQPPVDDRCPVQPKKQRCAEAGKATVYRDPKPRSL